MFAENPEIAFVSDWVYSINKQTKINYMNLNSYYNDANEFHGQE